MIELLLVDDHEVVRRGLRDLFEREDDITVVAEAGSVAEAEALDLPEGIIAVLDVRLADGSGVEICRTLRQRDPSASCLMLTSFADDEALFAAIMAGASGYVLKEVRSTELVSFGSLPRSVAFSTSSLTARPTVRSHRRCSWPRRP